MRLASALTAAMVVALGCGADDSSRKSAKEPCVSSLDGTPSPCDGPYATPKGNYHPVTAAPDSPEPPQERKPPKVKLTIGPPSDLDSDGVEYVATTSSVRITGRVRPSASTIKIEKAQFDRSGTGAGVAPYRTIRVRDGKIDVQVPIDAPVVQYRFHASARGHRTTSEQFEFKRKKKARQPAPETPSDLSPIPNEVGNQLQAAQDDLQAHGFYLLSNKDATGRGRFLIYDRNWVVVEQDPPAGTPAGPETHITLYAKKYSDP